MVGICFRSFKLLLLGSVLTACGSSQKTSVTDVHDIHRDSVSSVMAYQHTRDSFLTYFVKKHGVVQVHWTEYDTDKPTDPSTGRPPVKAEAKAEIKMDSHQQSAIAVNDSVQATARSDFTSDSSRNIHQNTETIKEGSSFFDNLRQTAVVLVVCLIVLGLVIFSIKKIMKSNS